MIWMKYLAYAIASIFVLFGASLIAGYFNSDILPGQLRLMMGIVLILYGIFRIVITYSKKDNDTNES